MKSESNGSLLEDDVMDNHYSDCGLHRGPAHRPTWCGCGGITHPVPFLAKLLAWVRMNWLYATRQL